MPELNSVNLFEYVRNGLFLRNIDKYGVYDIAIFEKFENTEIELEKIKIQTLEKLNYDFGIGGAINSFLENYENILLVLDEYNIIYLLPILDKIKEKNLTIINLATGISSYIHKQFPENKDIGLLANFGIRVQEPYDMNSFFEIIKNPQNKYIRIADKEMPINIFGDDHKNLASGVVSLTDYELSGTHGTLLCPGYMLEYSISAVQNGGAFYDVFCLVDYNFEISGELKSSILKTEKIVIILDQSQTTVYEKIVKAKLWEAGLFDTEIKFVYPEWEKITTTLKDYLFSQAEFDANALQIKL